MSTLFQDMQSITKSAIHVLHTMYEEVRRSTVHAVYEEMLPKYEPVAPDSDMVESESYAFAHDSEFDILYAQFGEADSAFPEIILGAYDADGQLLPYIFNTEQDVDGLREWARYIIKACDTYDNWFLNGSDDKEDAS